MRTLKIDVDGITELDLEEDEIHTPDTTWDCVELDDGHDIWVDDFGLFRSPGRVAALGDRRIPMPGYVLGAQGENSVAATIDIERVRELVKPNQSVIASIPTSFAALVTEERSGPDRAHICRVIVALPGTTGNVVEFLMRVPPDVRSPLDETHGDLRLLPFSAEEQMIALNYLLQRHRVDTIAVTPWTAKSQAVQILQGVGINIRVEDQAPHYPVLETSYGIGGELEMELQAVLDPTLPEFDWNELLNNPCD